MYEPDNNEIQAVIISQNTIEGISELNAAINDDTLGVSISALNFYCQKTGHIIGTRDENSLFQLAKIHGKNTISIALYNAVSLNVAPAWLYTNGENLDTMIDADPIGFACYCFGMITQEFYQSAKNKNQKLMPAIERYWALARANALLTQRGIGELPELNAELVKFLTYAPDTKSYLFRKIRNFAKMPDQLAMLAATGELTNLLREATNNTLNSIGRGNVALNYAFHVASAEKSLHEKISNRPGSKTGRDYEAFKEIYATPADAARGPSNVRKMRASSRDVKEAGMFAHFAKMFDDVGVNIKDFTPGTSDWLKKRAANAAKTQDVLFNSISELGKIDLDGIIAPNEAGDDEVEVRTIARDRNVIGQDAPKAVAELLSELKLSNEIPNDISAMQIAAYSQAIKLEQKPLSFREKLAALKAAQGRK